MSGFIRNEANPEGRRKVKGLPARRWRRRARASEAAICVSPVGGWPGATRACTKSTPNSVVEILADVSTGVSITGESFRFKGSCASFAITASSRPPFAESCRSMVPVRVVSDDSNEPDAAPPANSIPMTTATPSATAVSVSAVRKGSRKSGRKTKVRKRVALCMIVQNFRFFKNAQCAHHSGKRGEWRFRRLLRSGSP